ncbi:carbonic anhydrase [Clostridium polyendosporum]|uniref:Carbonic anhydrase n=1 Tax=Clostridium polyendosporum TaxID=69208 RepID=A0A919S2H7_9CLOT|nr:carbonic anhydrase [Clostridium polyendosporum]GIM30040.1 carbonic anhydrase [Clostridium polyendosporum]
MKKNVLLKKLTVALVAGLLSVGVLSGCSNKETKSIQTEKETNVIATHDDNLHKDKVTAGEAEKAIIEGNKRFVSGKLANKDLSSEVRKDLSKNGQHPFAVVLTCSDSRVAPELVFDQGLGDLFVIRDAGNVVDAIETGSVEYAVEHLNVPLVVVLGHEKCGAVQATIEGGEATPDIEVMINKIKPSLDKIKVENKDAKQEEIASMVEDENAKETVNELLKSSAIKHLVDSGKLKVVAAKYHLESGEVEFLK